jgi:D-serine deaminase-like pyridoxal phosphate-dependent protein
VGDTPGCVLSPALGDVDEIRPGNFVFFDAHQLLQEVCHPEDVAVALACPVVAKHPERREVVIYGGAIHLSKDFRDDGDWRVFGLLALPQAGGWSTPVPGAYPRPLSQEHGVIVVPGPKFDALAVGGLVCILSVHSCLTVQVMRHYRTLDGRLIKTLNC